MTSQTSSAEAGLPTGEVTLPPSLMEASALTATFIPFMTKGIMVFPFFLLSPPLFKPRAARQPARAFKRCGEPESHRHEWSRLHSRAQSSKLLSFPNLIHSHPDMEIMVEVTGTIYYTLNINLVDFRLVFIYSVLVFFFFQRSEEVRGLAVQTTPVPFRA